MHDRGFCCHGDINSRLPAQTHNWVRIERWRGAVKIPLMKVEHQSCCRRLQSTHNQMKCLAERRRHNRTWLTTLWKLIRDLRMNKTTPASFFFNIVCFLLSPLKAPPGHFCCFILSHFIALFFFLSAAGKLVWVHLALIFVSQAAIFCVFYSSPEMMEINSHKRSGPLWQAQAAAGGSSDPSEWQTKEKISASFMPSPEIPLKICSCRLWSAPQFFYWCFFFFKGGGGGVGVARGCGCSEACAGWVWCRPPRIKPTLLFLPLAFYISSIHNKKYLGTDEWLEATSKLQRVFF